MREIGSSFEFEFEVLESQIDNNMSDFFLSNMNNLRFFSLGRNAINYLIKYFIDQESKVLLPNYLCESILDSFAINKLNYEFYEIDSNFHIDIKDLKKKLTDNSIVFFINYFGFQQSSKVLEELYNIKETTNVKIVEDITQSIFNSSDVSDFKIASLRKWFPIPDGAFLASDFNLNEHTVKSPYNKFIIKKFVGQVLKKYYLTDNKNREINKQLFLDLLNESEDYIEKSNQILSITELSLEILKKIDLESVKIKRRQNYIYLLNDLLKVKDIDVCFKNLDDSTIPIGFPIITNKRDKLKNHLINNNIYPPVHWNLPEVIKENGNEHCIANMISESILTIPCDQRYSENDMQYITNVINDFFES